MKLLGVEYWGIMIPHKIQPGDIFDGWWYGWYFTHICYATFNDWNGERNVNVNRNDNDWDDNWWFAGMRN